MLLADHLGSVTSPCSPPASFPSFLSWLSQSITFSWKSFPIFSFYSKAELTSSSFAPHCPYLFPLHRTLVDLDVHHWVGIFWLDLVGRSWLTLLSPDPMCIRASYPQYAHPLGCPGPALCPRPWECPRMLRTCPYYVISVDRTGYIAYTTQRVKWKHNISCSKVKNFKMETAEH
jgi:hypothetical protein